MIIGTMNKLLVLLLLSAVCVQSLYAEEVEDDEMEKDKVDQAKTDLDIPPPKRIWIPWDEVGPYHFTVFWVTVRDAKFYKVELLLSYTTKALKTLNRVSTTTGSKNGSHTFTGLDQNSVYGIRIWSVSESGIVGSESTRAATRTTAGTTKAPVTTKTPTKRPPVGNCGSGKFTCGGSKKCISGAQWCDRRIHCNDKSDERNCPGGCDEINSSDFRNGNFTCTRYGSPRSACLFQCNQGYRRSGSYYTQCLKGEWSRTIPQCRLSATEDIGILYTLGQAEVRVRDVPFAFGYRVFLESYEEEDSPIITYDFPPAGPDERGNELFTIDNLIEGTNYRMWVSAMDEYDVEGIPSDKLEFIAEEMY